VDGRGADRSLSFETGFVPGAWDAVKLIQNIPTMIEPDFRDDCPRARVFEHGIAQRMMLAPRLTKRLKGVAITDLHSRSDGIGFLVIHQSSGSA
jgi:hypothetical protein